MKFVNVTQKEASNRLRILYPLWIIFGVFGLVYVPSLIPVAGDVATTAKAVLENQTLFQLSIVSNFIVQFFQIAAALYLFILFMPVDKKNAMLIPILGILGVPISLVSEILNYGALQAFVLGNNVMGYSLLQMASFGIQVASLFWALWLFPIGYLVYKSGYMPNWVGFLLYVGGIGYLLGAIGYVFTGTLNSVFEFFTMGETIFLLYLVIKGPKLKKK